MSAFPRPPHLHHCTSEPYRFFGRAEELRWLDEALAGSATSVVALVGPGGQGKTAIVQHWLEQLTSGRRHADGIFLWSFYRAKDADLCLRELYAYAGGMTQPPEVSATYCVDHLLPLLRRERWALVLDGTEVAQYESGPWFGRFLHPELARLLEELASAPLPGVVVLTSRFPLPDLERRKHAHILTLGGLDRASARGLLRSVGVEGREDDLDEASAWCGFHAKALELLGTYLVRFRRGAASAYRQLPDVVAEPGSSDEERKVLRVLAAFQAALSQEAKDLLALATAFRDPPAESRLLEYLASPPVQTLLHQTWGRQYPSFSERPAGWLASQVNELVQLRLLERVGLHTASQTAVIDAHPLVRRGFEHATGTSGQRQGAQARAGFLRGRPDRRPPASLEEAREEVELFHAYCDAGLWNEADNTYVALDNPKHRFLAPAFERDLLLCFFPDGDWRRPPLWSGFGRYRSLAICFELMGQFEEALSAYPTADAPLRGDALIALGRLEPLLEQPHAPHPWQTLWQAYRAHALCLAGRTTEAVALARSLVPVDVYEWVHVFECLLRARELTTIDLSSVLYRPPHSLEHRWSTLARQRMRTDYLRLTSTAPAPELGPDYEQLLDAYDRGGMPYERALTRLSYARWLQATKQFAAAQTVNIVTLELARRHTMPILEADAWEVQAECAQGRSDASAAQRATEQIARLRQHSGYPCRGRL
jgi:tetratricopeptide (TPR) repeat protein